MSYTVADSKAVALDFDSILDKIAKLQREKAELEKELKALKKPAKAEMKARGIKTYVTPEGTNASLYDTNRTNADRKAAQEVCTPEQLAAIFKVNTTENFKVK
jgi:hypothetical protein